MKSTPLAGLAFRTISISLAAFATISLAGCTHMALLGASFGMGHSPYKPAESSSSDNLYVEEGYGEVRIADDQYTVYFKGAMVAVGKKKITADDKEMARLRAAELTLLQGYTYFIILHERVSTDILYFSGKDASDCCTDAVLPTAVLQIQLLKAADSSVPNALDAKSVIAELGPKYDPKKYPKVAR